MEKRKRKSRGDDKYRSTGGNIKRKNRIERLFASYVQNKAVE